MLFNNKGFTLVEMLLAVLVGAIVLGAAYIGISAGLRSSASMERKVSAQQDVRAAINLMTAEISMASFNPTFADNAVIWADLSSTTGGACEVSAAAPSNPGSKGIREATMNSITVEADINGDGSITNIATPQSSEVIRYFYDTANQRITRCTCCTAALTGSGGQSFLGSNVANQKVVNVINGNSAIYSPAIPVFRYFDADDNQISFDGSGAIPAANIPNIRRVDITLAIETNRVDQITGSTRKMIYSSKALVRNHPINFTLN